MLSYNLAHYSATVNNSIVEAGPKDLVYQVTWDFRHHYCFQSGADGMWDGVTALFALWLGINELAFLILPWSQALLTDDFCSVERTYLDLDPNAKILAIMESYLRLIHELYDCGARRFLLINVPPITRSPKMLRLKQRNRRLHEKAVHNFNRQLAKAAQDWRRFLGSVSLDPAISITFWSLIVSLKASIQFYDCWTFMTDILDNHEKYGFDSNDCRGQGCIWWDEYHPSSRFHRLLAADLQEKLGLTFWVVDSSNESAG